MAKNVKKIVEKEVSKQIKKFNKIFSKVPSEQERKKKKFSKKQEKYRNKMIRKTFLEITKKEMSDEQLKDYLTIFENPKKEGFNLQAYVSILNGKTDRGVWHDKNK